MSIIQPLNGLNGKVTLEIDSVETTIAGLNSFTISEDARIVTDVPPQFGQDRATNLIQYKQPIGFSMEGFYLQGIDAAQTALKTAYDNTEQLFTLKFYLNENEIIRAKTSTDYWQIATIGEITTSPDGFASFSASGFLYFEYLSEFQS